MDQKGDTQEHTNKTIRTRAPEQVVVVHPPPEPDYPRYRVEPGQRASLATVDPNETEHYKKKKDVAKALEKQRRRIQNL